MPPSLAAKTSLAACELLSARRADRLHDPANRHAAPDHGVVIGVADAGDDGGAVRGSSSLMPEQSIHFRFVYWSRPPPGRWHGRPLMSLHSIGPSGRRAPGRRRGT